jgi:2',3'-cyclic-nucleotide 2'-phosphodiesterase (5'-nucleotidase family)
MAEVLSETPVAMTRTEGPGSTSIGNLLADVMRDAVGADAALHNKTGIRADLPAGTLTMRHAYQVSPFPNNIVVIELTGEQLERVLEYTFADVYYSVEVSGLLVCADMARPSGDRVVMLDVAGAPVDPARVYRVATNSFLAAGGDGHTVLATARGRRDSGTGMRDALVARLKRQRAVAADASPRVHVATADRKCLGPGAPADPAPAAPRAMSPARPTRP